MAVKEKPILCYRCQSVMVGHYMVASEELCLIPCYRCPTCGDVVDDVILENRRKSEGVV